MKVYIAKQENYHVLACEIGACTILGVYDNINKALKKILENVELDINEYDYILDNECSIEEFKKDKQGYIRLFYKYQENWDYHCEYSIEEHEVQL